MRKLSRSKRSLLLLKIEFRVYLNLMQLRESKQQCGEDSKKIINLKADILLLSSANERVKILEHENQHMKILKQ